MFLGHFALGLAAKRAAPGVSLAVLFAAAQLADLLWPVFLALGLEQVRIDPGNTVVTPLDFVSYPYTHSLVLLIVWGVVMGWIVARRERGALPIVAALVVSHWFLDFVTHRPDMPIYPGSARYGLELWKSVGATVAVEVPMFLAGVWIYMKTTQPKDGMGRWGFLLLITTLLLVYIGDMMTDGAPPSVPALTVVALIGGILFTAWSGLADRHRAPRSRT